MLFFKLNRNFMFQIIVFILFTCIRCADAAEQILSDEMSLWHSPGNSGGAYSTFEPLRVRRDGAEYFFRNNPGHAFRGSHYGEVNLLGESGGIIYLPRDIDLKNASELKVYLRKSNSNSKWIITLYKSPALFVEVKEGSNYAAEEKKGEWTEVIINLKNLRYVNKKISLPVKPVFREPEVFASLYKVPENYLWGIRIGLEGGRKGDSLDFDSLALDRIVYGNSQRVIRGRIEPIVPNVSVILSTDKGINQAIVDRHGKFSIPLPAGATKTEIIAKADKYIFTPKQGRFLELGDYIPDLFISTSETGVVDSPLIGNSNTSRYFYGDKMGPRIEPNLHFGVTVEEENKRLVFAELASNNLGYIDRDHRPLNSDGAYRILWLGECHQMGVHIAQSDSWVNQAEGLLSIQNKTPIEIISASFHYSPFINAWPAFVGLTKAYRPNMIVLPIIHPEVLNLNIEEYIMEWLSASKGHLPTYQFELSKSGKLIRHQNDGEWEVYREAMPDDKRKEIRKKYYTWEYVRENRAEAPPWVSANTKAILGALKEYTKEAKRNNARVVLMYISDFHFQSKKVEGSGTYDPKLFHDEMKSMALHSGMEFVDLSTQIYKGMPGNDSDKFFYRGNGHWTPYGHYRAGVALADFLDGSLGQKNGKNK